MLVSTTICAIIAMFPVDVALGQTTTPNSAMAGYQPRYPGGVDTYLLRDLGQQDFELNMNNGNCGDVDYTRWYWESNPENDDEITYLNSIPTYSMHGKPFGEYTHFTDETEFHIQWVNHSLYTDKTNYERGNANWKAAFYDPNGSHGTYIEPGEGNCIGSEESAIKATRYMFGFIEAVQLMQKAIDHAGAGDCPAESDDSSCTEAWDASVAIYVGSLEGTDGNNNSTGWYGNTLYSLADEMCWVFKTCGPEPGWFDRTLPADINTRILTLYAAGSFASRHGSFINMEYYKRRISAKMMVPFVQGVFKYGYRLSDGGTNTGVPLSQWDKDVAKAGTFSMMAGPKLRACSRNGWNKQKQELKIGGQAVAGVAANFQTIKLAYECNYKCLGISCAEVGALYDGDTVPKQGAEACNDKENGSSFEFICHKQSKKRKKACGMFKGREGIPNRSRSRYFHGKFEDLEDAVEHSSTS